MATAFSEVLAPGELSETYSTTHAPLVSHARVAVPACVLRRARERGRMDGSEAHNHRCENTKRPWYTPLLQIIVRKARIHALCAKPQTVSSTLARLATSSLKPLPVGPVQ